MLKMELHIARVESSSSSDSVSCYGTKSTRRKGLPVRMISGFADFLNSSYHNYKFNYRSCSIASITVLACYYSNLSFQLQ